MKSWILSLLMVFWMLVMGLFGISAYAFEWQQTNQATIAWDAVTKTDVGEPFPEGSVIKYMIYSRNVDGSDSDEDVGETSELTYTITFTAEGRYIIGVSARRYVEDKLVGESQVNWSNVNGDSTSDPFGFIFYAAPAMPKGLRK